MTATTSKEFLLQAADLVEHRWTTGAAIRPDENGVACFCAIGALQAVGLPAIPDSPREWEEMWDSIYGDTYEGERSSFPHEVYEAAVKAASDETHRRVGLMIVAFNDRIARSGEEVSEVFRAAAANLDSGDADV